METIKSRQNPKIRLARALQKRKKRDAEKLYLIEGSFHIGEALVAAAPFEYLLYAPELIDEGFAAKLAIEIEAQGVPTYQVSEDILSSLSGREHPRGLLAVAQQQYSRLSDLHADNFAKGVAVVAPQDPGNLGSLLRTIDAAGASGLLILDGGVDVYHPSAVRAGMGAQFWKPIARATFDEFSSWAKEHDYAVFGSSARGKGNYREIAAKEPFILLMGSEREGLSSEQLEICDEVLGLPMRGRATSLNLAVAAGVLLYSLMGD
jgi:TrmH family RNA methyltransferase